MFESDLWYMNMVLYDAINDVVFEERFYIQKLTMNFRNKVHPKVDDMDSVTYSGKVKNTGDDGIVVLGCL